MYYSLRLLYNQENSALSDSELTYAPLSVGLAEQVALSVRVGQKPRLYILQDFIAVLALEIIQLAVKRVISSDGVGRRTQAGLFTTFSYSRYDSSSDACFSASRT